jgi:protein-tyrosine sulfotransferase
MPGTPDHRRAPAPRLAFIVGVARSGTTLLRLLMDAHPEVGAPAETGIPGLIEASARAWATIAAGGPDGDGITIPAKRAIRRSVASLTAAYCADSHKPVFCDKSLGTAEYLPVIHEVFPRARAVIVVRHVMDTIISGLEASPWGFTAYGYAPFVRTWPGNHVAALAAYWAHYVSLGTQWEADHKRLCHRVRYEDLVANPQGTLAALFAFLGVSGDVDVVQRHFARQRPSTGPGDYKTQFTDAVTDASVGRGKRVPIHMIPPDLLDRVNTLLEAYGYEPLEQSWNASPSPSAEPRPDLSAQLEMAFTREAVAPLPHDFPVATVGIVADDDPALRWIVDVTTGQLRRGDGDVDMVVTGSTEDLLELVQGSENVGVLLQSGRVRHVTASERDQSQGEIHWLMQGITAMLRAAPTPQAKRDGTSSVPSNGATRTMVA